MIGDREIESKYFYFGLSKIIARLDFACHFLEEETGDGGDFGSCENDVAGLASILEDAVIDLRKIYKALYGDDEKAAPETEASPEDGQGPGQENT